MRPTKIGLIAHTGKPGVAELIRALGDGVRSLQAAGVARSENGSVGRVCASDCTIDDLGRQADLLVVLGGDGTILNVVGQLGDLHQAGLRDQCRFARLPDLRKLFGLRGGR